MFELRLVEYDNFEAGEGKFVGYTFCSHQQIVRWVRPQMDLESG